MAGFRRRLCLLAALCGQFSKAAFDGPTPAKPWRHSSRPLLPRTAARACRVQFLLEAESSGLPFVAGGPLREGEDHANDHDANGLPPPNLKASRKGGPFSMRRFKVWINGRLQQGSLDKWTQVFSECDRDSTGTIDRRELLVVLHRLGLPIPSDERLDDIIRKYDIDESGELDFEEFSIFVRECFGASYNDSEDSQYSLREQMRSRLMGEEERPIMLWKTIFDQLDTFPSDGYLRPPELYSAFNSGFFPLKLEYKKVVQLLQRYDENGDQQLSFDEFCQMATDVVSSHIAYTRALEGAEASIDAWEEAYGRAQTANRLRPAAEEALNVTMEAIDRRLAAAFAGSDTFNAAIGVQKVQDDLFRKFKLKYGGEIEIDDSLDANRVMLLDALRLGDLNTIRSLTSMSWDFVYAPSNDDCEMMKLEAWCRTPLCLLVRPDEGSFKSFLQGVTEKERQSLLLDVLASGCADPNYPPTYWSSPAVHACFEGDINALDALRSCGCDLRQTIEWVGQEQAGFNLVHAAAFNGQLEILKYLRKYFPPSFFRELDATGSNALHTVLASSSDMPTAMFLLEQGCDGFAYNSEGKTPLGMAIETLPELAQILLESRARFEYRWWGNDLYWFSFQGVVLPLKNQLRPMEVPKAVQQSLPMAVTAQDGKPATIEELIIRHQRKKLLETPVMLDLIERKWDVFGSALYQKNILAFGLVLVSTFIGSFAKDVGSPEFYGTTLLTLGAWTYCVKTRGLQVEEGIASFERLFDRLKTGSKGVTSFDDVLDRLKNRGEGGGEEGGASPGDVGLLSPAFKYFNFVGVPACCGFRILDSMGLFSIGVRPRWAGVLFGATYGFLQVSLALEMLELISLFRALGPLVITCLYMLDDATRLAAILGIITLGFANGFFALIHTTVAAETLDALDGDFSYIGILKEMGLWLSGQASYDLIDPLPGDMQFGLQLLFWGYVLSGYFVLINLLIAIFNSTYERVTTNSFSEWLYIRLVTLLEFEKDKSSPEVREYYAQLEARDNQRGVNKFAYINVESTEK